MKLQLIRHASLWVRYAGANFLIDPMFSREGENPPIVGSANERRNPLVALPAPPENWLRPDAVVVTHLHRDHWDEAAAAALPKETPVFCQPGDEAAFAAAGFAAVTAVQTEAGFGGTKLCRTGGQHGTGEIGRRMGRVSGFAFRAAGEPTLYVAGDTVWCEEVRRALDEHRPDVTVVNAGGARFAVGDAITMEGEDVVRVCRHAPYTQVVAVHMDSLNHCLVTRADLAARLSEAGLRDRVMLPQDGETI